MRKTIFILAIIILTVGNVFVSCQLSSKNQETAGAKAQDDKQNSKVIRAAGVESYTVDNERK